MKKQYELEIVLTNFSKKISEVIMKDQSKEGLQKKIDFIIFLEKHISNYYHNFQVSRDEIKIVDDLSDYQMD